MHPKLYRNTISQQNMALLKKIKTSFCPLNNFAIPLAISMVQSQNVEIK